MEGDSTLFNPTSDNVSDVPIAFQEPPENLLTAQSPSADEFEEETGNVSDDQIKALHLEIEALRIERSDLQQMLASSIADFEALVVKSSEAENARAAADMAKTVLEDKKSDLEDHVRFLEGLVADLEKAKESETAKAETERVSLMKKEEEINILKEALNKCKEELETEKENTRYVLAKENKVVSSFEEKLRLEMEKNEEVISSLTEELRIEREKSKEVFAEKEGEIVSLKKVLLLAKEKHDFVKNMLEEESKQLKDDVSKLEERIQKILSGDENGDFRQNNRGIEPKKVEGLKFSWVTTAAIMTSTGTAAAAITAFCLLHKKQG